MKCFFNVESKALFGQVKTIWHQEHTYENLLHALSKYMVQILYVRFPLKWNTFRKNAQARPTFLLFPSNAAHTQLKFRIRIFNGLEKGTYAPNNHEQAFVQREETKD